MKAIFLYTELADYTMACFRMHLELNPGDEIHAVHYPVNPEAPFEFDSFPGLQLYSREETEIEDLWEIFNSSRPDVIVCSGWNDAFYNKFVKATCKLVPVYLCFDNVFRGTAKQIAGLLPARMMFRGVYAGAWVPGLKQKEFARILGFPADRIYTGFYSTNTKKFSEIYIKHKAEKSEKFPRRFLCVARYIPQKGLEALWQAFAELCAEGHTKWELWCAGTGINFSDRMIHEKINHLGFVQPSEFEELIAKCGVFVLPSMFEPWGVVVNEFAAAGMPLLLSDAVGSGSAYLLDGENGYLFKPGKVKAMKSALKKIMALSDAELLEMGEKSHSSGLKMNAENWSETLTKIGGHQSTME